MDLTVELALGAGFLGGCGVASLCLLTFVMDAKQAIRSVGATLEEAKAQIDEGAETMRAQLKIIDMQRELLDKKDTDIRDLITERNRLFDKLRK